MKLTPDELAEMVVGTIKRALDGPKVGGRLAATRGAPRAAENEAVCEILRHV